MRTALLVSRDDALRARLARALESHAVFAASSDGDALKILRDTGIDLIIKDASPTACEAADFVARVRQIRPSSVVVCVVPTEPASSNGEAAGEDADFVLLQPFTTRHLQGVLRQVSDKARLLQEVAALRAARLLATSVSMAAQGPPLGTSSLIPTQVLRELAKVLAAGFELPRVLDLFLDVVSELMHPSRSAILLADPGSRRFRVRASRGLAPHLVQSVVLSAEDGLPLWLAAEGRLIGAEEARAHASDPGAHEIAREMALLQAVLAVPLLAHGELLAILTLGQRITGGAYQQPEDEVASQPVRVADRVPGRLNMWEVRHTFTDDGTLKRGGDVVGKVSLAPN